jgi:hypothetical protein
MKRVMLGKNISQGLMGRAISINESFEILLNFCVTFYAALSQSIERPEQR